MFKLYPCDLDFVTDAKSRFVHRLVLPAPPELVFKVVASAQWEKEWFPNFLRADWLSPPPHGRGSVRRYQLTFMTAIERFLVWEPGRRLAFCFDELSLPMLRRFLEYYTFLPTSDGHTELLWQVCYEPLALLRPFRGVVHRHFARDFQRARAQLAEVVERVASTQIATSAMQALAPQ